MAKSSPHHCSCGINIAIFGWSYTRHKTSLNIPSCWMTSEFCVCNVEKWNGTSKFQKLMTFYLWLKTSSVEHFGTNIIWLFWNFCFATLRLSFPCPLNRVGWRSNDTTIFCAGYMRKRSDHWYSLETVNLNLGVHFSSGKASFPS